MVFFFLGFMCILELLMKSLMKRGKFFNRDEFWFCLDNLVDVDDLFIVLLFSDLGMLEIVVMLYEFFVWVYGLWKFFIFWIIFFIFRLFVSDVGIVFYLMYFGLIEILEEVFNCGCFLERVLCDMVFFFFFLK